MSTYAAKREQTLAGEEVFAARGPALENF